MQRATLILFLLVSATAVCADEPSVAWAPQPTTAEEFTASMDYLVRDGGEWRAPNKEFGKESEFPQPRDYTYQFKWGVGKEIVLLQIGGLFDDERRASYWEIVMQWVPKDKKIRLHQYGWNGAMMTGTRTIRKDGVEEIRMSGVMPDGSSIEFRDETVPLDENRMRSTSSRLVDGTWVTNDVLTWERVRGSE